MAQLRENSAVSSRFVFMYLWWPYHKRAEQSNFPTEVIFFQEHKVSGLIPGCTYGILLKTATGRRHTRYQHLRSLEVQNSFKATGVWVCDDETASCSIVHLLGSLHLLRQPEVGPTWGPQEAQGFQHCDPVQRRKGWLCHISAFKEFAHYPGEKRGGCQTQAWLPLGHLQLDGNPRRHWVQRHHHLRLRLWDAQDRVRSGKLDLSNPTRWGLYS